MRLRILALEVSLRQTETAELDGDARADSQKWGEGALVEGEGALIDVDRLRCLESGGVCCAGLKTDFDYIEWLTYSQVSCETSQNGVMMAWESQCYSTIATLEVESGLLIELPRMILQPKMVLNCYFIVVAAIISCQLQHTEA